MIVTGLRGVGKTVLLREFQKKAAERKWAIVDLEVGKHDDRFLRRQIGELMRQALLNISHARGGANEAREPLRSCDRSL